MKGKLLKMPLGLRAPPVDLGQPATIVILPPLRRCGYCSEPLVERVQLHQAPQAHYQVVLCRPCKAFAMMRDELLAIHKKGVAPR